MKLKRTDLNATCAANHLRLKVKIENYDESINSIGQENNVIVSSFFSSTAEASFDTHYQFERKQLS